MISIRFWRSALLVLSSLAGVLLGIQEWKGTLASRSFVVELQQAREIEDGALRFGLQLAPSLWAASAVRQGNASLRMCAQRTQVSDGEPGVFAWTHKNLWVKPLNSAESISVIVPVSVPWWAWVVMLIWVGFGVLGAYKSLPDRALWAAAGEGARGWFGPPDSTRSSVWGSIVLAMVIGVLALLNSGFGKPIWIDEFLHFCLGGYDTAAEAWTVLRETLVTINHGQTGVYMMVDYGMVKAFGANIIALRAPSIACGVWMLSSAVLLLRWRGVSWPWQLSVLVALLGQRELMAYIGEARPYMPLAAASMGTMAYYFAPAEIATTRLLRAWGWGSVLLGCVMHPYFSIYWLSAFLIAHAERVWRMGQSLRVATAVEHMNLPMVLVGSVLYFGIGASTWLRGGPDFSFDPFHWISREALLTVFVSGSHFQFLGDHSIRWATVGAVVWFGAVMCCSLARRWKALVPLLGPTLMLISAITISVLLAYLSYRRDYWILSRQWLGSVALVPVAVVWMLASVLGESRRRWRWSPLVGWMVFMVLLSDSVSQALQNGARQWRIGMANFAGTGITSVQEPLEREPQNNDEWVDLANKNIQSGGPVWSRFRGFYGRLDEDESDTTRSE